MATERSDPVTLTSWTSVSDRNSTDADQTDHNPSLPSHHSTLSQNLSIFTTENPSSDITKDASPKDDIVPCSLSVDMQDKTEDELFPKSSSHAETVSGKEESGSQFGTRPAPTATSSVQKADSFDGDTSFPPNESLDEERGMTTSAAYPILDWGDGFFTNATLKGPSSGEMFDMVSLSGRSSPKEGHELIGETLFHDLAHEKQGLKSPSFVDHAIHEDNKRNSLLQSSLSCLEKAEEFGGAGVKGHDGAKKVEENVDIEEEKNMTPLRQLLSLWYVALILLTPIILLPLPIIVNTPESKCAYVIFVMAVFWVSEVIPIPVTSLMPIFLLPMMGLLTARTTSAAYINDTSILFLGGLTVAIAIERWNLHRRLALGVMLVVGSQPRWLMLGMMSVTWFLSMWISNTATTAMMLPIVQAVLQQISSAESDHGTPHEKSDLSGSDDDVDDPAAMKKTGKQRPAKDSKKRCKGPDKTQSGHGRAKESRDQGMSMKKLGKALSLAIAYSANVGGIASLTGTGPNLVLLGQSQIIFEKVGLNTPITFATWLVYGLPLSFILLLVVWVWLQIIFLRCHCGCECVLKRTSGAKADDRDSKVRDIIRAELRKLGPISYAEGTIMVCFVILVVLWITRDLGGAGGWANIFQSGFVSDSTPAILIAVLMFVLPSSLPDIFFRSRRQGKKERKAVPALLNWPAIQEKMPWSLYLLLGGGFAIAQAAQESGLSEWLGEKLSVFGALDPWLMLLIICYIVTFVTEVTSNTAIATIMMPILAQLSLTLNLNPLFFMFPTALTTSFAFMLPVATPPNAIVFAFGAVRVIDMVLCGFLLNVLSVPCLLLATVTWGNAFFHFDLLPPQFLNNVTTLLSNTTSV